MTASSASTGPTCRRCGRWAALFLPLSGVARGRGGTVGASGKPTFGHSQPGRAEKGYRPLRLSHGTGNLMEESRVPRRTGVGLALGTAFLLVVSMVAAAGTSFTTPTRMGYPAGDDWEPAVASDGQGNVYVLVTHFGGVPGCSGCANPSILLQVSHDGGSTFTAPVPMTVSSAVQFDPQVKVNALGYVFVSYLFGKVTVVQRSTDHGTTWTNPVVVNVGIRQGPTDKDGLAVDGRYVYVGFDVSVGSGNRFYVAVSADYGNTFTVSMMNNTYMGVVLNGGAAVGPDGSVYLAWEAIHQGGNALGPQDELVTASHDHGATWSLSFVDRNLPPGPDCSYASCGYDFLGTGSAIAVDGSGAVYVLYNAPLYYRGPPYIWMSRSTDGGQTWSPRQMVNADGTAAWHAFPAIAAGAAGDVRVAWMDNRTGPVGFNVWYKQSSGGGAHWSAEVRVSQYTSGYPWITQQGFAFPYGDYFILDLDSSGHVFLAWGEGPSYAGPGNVFAAHS